MLCMRFLAVAAVLAAAPVQARPEAPEQSRRDFETSPETGNGCDVSADGVTTQFDPTCNYHFLNRYDGQGRRLWFSYRDQGQLQGGQEYPDRAVRNDFLCMIGAYYCAGYEFAFSGRSLQQQSQVHPAVLTKSTARA